VGCIESLHRSELATFFAYDAQLIVGHLNPTNFGIDRDTGVSTSFCLLDLLPALLNGFLTALECGFFGLIVLVLKIAADHPPNSPYTKSHRLVHSNGPDHRPELI
jgi:hypothetical protein